MKNVLITGASSGIGAATARALDRLGYRVFAGVRKPADGERLRRDASGNLTPVQLDVTDTTSIQAAAAGLGVDSLAGLINNAGIVVSGPLEFLPIDKLRQQFEINVIGQMAVTQAFLPLLRKGGGRVINIGSVSGRVTAPFLGPYSASKCAFAALTTALRMELRTWNLPVVLIEPGSTATPIWEKSIDAAKRVLDAIPAAGRELYGPMLSKGLAAADKIASKAAPVEKVVKVIVKALTAKRPRTRYVVGVSRALLGLLSVVPESLREKMLLAGIR